MGDIQYCFNRKMDFHPTASPSPFPCIEITRCESLIRQLYFFFHLTTSHVIGTYSHEGDFSKHEKST